jgi:exopolyphosphatase/guanosine-5'-triphosphate,3'-diphosphate pyrophosphatase
MVWLDQSGVNRSPRTQGAALSIGDQIEQEPHRDVRIGAVDIGTNSVRLLVADVDDDERLRTSHRMGEISRLGEGLDRTGLIDEVAASRTLECLERFVHEAEYSGASRIRVAGTNAPRRSKRPEIAPARPNDTRRDPHWRGGGAARLPAALSGPNPRASCSVVVDIGGGATQNFGQEATAVISLELMRVLQKVRPTPTETELGVAEFVQGVFREKLEFVPTA